MFLNRRSVSSFIVATVVVFGGVTTGVSLGQNSPNNTITMMGAAPAAPAAKPAGAAAAAGGAKVTFTADQAERGHQLYTKNCADCHGANLDDGEFGGAPLKGSEFTQKYFGTTADALYGFMQTAMPPDRPGGLSEQEYADLTAYVLSVNGLQAGGAELPGNIDKLSKLTVNQ
jgi:mono/diheme cytochrome c family protein